MMMTMHDKLCAALEARGEVKLAQIDGYTVYRADYHATRKDGQLLPLSADFPVFWYVGRSGALRVGYSVQTSEPIANAVKRALLAEGETALARRKTAKLQLQLVA